MHVSVVLRFSYFWPSWAALGRSFAALGSLLGRSWPLFRRSQAALGPSWPLLGRSWGALGRSWVALGRPSAALRTACKNHPKIDAKNDRFGLPKALQNGSKIAPKSVQKTMQKTMRKNIEMRPSRSRLGAILGHFRSRLGVKNVEKTLCFQLFLKTHFFEKMMLETRLGPILYRF